MGSVYNWDNFPIGQTRVLSHRYRQSVRVSLNTFVKTRQLDWEFSLRSDPTSPKPGERCKTIWVTRVVPQAERLASGLSNGEQDIPGVEYSKADGKVFEAPQPRRGVPAITRPVFYDVRDVPIKERMAYHELWHHRVRMTKTGWERFEVGGYAVVPTRQCDILFQLKSALIPRSLPWRFEIRRVQNPANSSDLKPHYLVTRIR